MKKWVSWLSRFLVGWWIDSALIKEIKGLDNFPPDRNFIFAQNHLSYMDLFIDGYICSPRRFTYIGQVDKLTGIKGFLRDLLYDYAEVIRINRNDKNSKKKAVDKAIAMLKQGYTLIIYPEGTRSRDGKLHNFKPGAAKIHLESGIPILPVGVKGTYELMPPGKGLQIKKIVSINIGKPLDFTKEREQAKNLDKNSSEYYTLCDNITCQIETSIRNLLAETQKTQNAKIKV